jgi:hypothetical protein
VTETPADAVLARITADLVERGVDVGTVVVVSATTLVWPDGSLGCPEPGRSYAQQLVEGSRIVVEAAGRRYDYRTSASGALRLCSHGAVKSGSVVLDVP